MHLREVNAKLPKLGRNHLYPKWNRHGEGVVHVLKPEIHQGAFDSFPISLQAL